MIAIDAYLVMITILELELKRENKNSLLSSFFGKQTH
jgi:hypothetical protein